MKKENGITIVALTVTIVILIILTGVTLNLTIGDEGIITMAKGHKENIQVDSTISEAQVIMMQLESETENGSYSYDELGNRLKQKELIESYVINSNGLIGKISDNNTLVVYNDKVTVVSENNKSNILSSYKLSISKETPYTTINFTAVQLNDGIRSITLPNNEIITCNNETMKTVTYEVNENGTYTFKITDGKNNKITETVKITNVKKDAIALITDRSLSKWTSEFKISAIFPNYSDGYVNEISVDGGNSYITYSGAVTVYDNCVIKARVRRDNTIFVENSLTISKIDKIKPTATITTSNVIFGVGAKIVLDDAGSGVDLNNCKYVITNSAAKLGENVSSYTDGNLTAYSTEVKKVKAAGTYYVHVLVTDNSGNKNEIVSSSFVSVDSTINYSYTGAVQNVELLPGKYKLEVWGAEGGYRSSTTYAGKGGYSVGTISLSSITKLFVYVGGSGNTGRTNGGFNGGGSRATYNGGGGGTDFRVATDSLYARVIVAGGGGSDGAKNKAGMYGGGTSGGKASSGYGTGGQAGTATAGGSGSSNSATTKGKFGQGGTGCSASSGYGGAGGGGWYGGAGSYPDSSGDDDLGGGGGSGYVYTSSTASNYPAGCLLNSSYYLSNASTTAGNASMPATSSGTEKGHSGNGYARITNMN